MFEGLIIKAVSIIVLVVISFIMGAKYQVRKTQKHLDDIEKE